MASSVNTSVDSKNGGRIAVRDSSGNQWVVAHDGALKIYKGDGSSTTSFTETDSADNPSYGYGASAAIDSSDVIHISSWRLDTKNGGLNYVTFNASTEQWGTQSQVANQQDGSGAAYAHTDIAIDSNGSVHIVYSDEDANMGTSYGTVYYTNNVSGGGSTFKTAVEVEGVTAEKNCWYPMLAIDSDNIPVISYTNSTDDDIASAEGNANNATSFTLHDVFSDTHSYPSSANEVRFTSIAVDNAGDHHIAYVDIDANLQINGDIKCIKHNHEDAWTTWQTAESVVSGNVKMPSLVIDGTDRYIFYNDDDDSDIYYYYDTGSGWTSGGSLETGTYRNPVAKWAYWYENDSTGALMSYSASYDFDASDAGPTDSGASWTNDSNAFDENDGTYAYTTSSSAGVLEGTGTTAPTTGGNIVSVEFRYRTGTNSHSASWTSWFLLSVPSGGWTWQKINDLEIEYTTSSDTGVFIDAAVIHSATTIGSGTTQEYTGASEYRVFRAQVRVYVRASISELDYGFFDDTGGLDLQWNTVSLASGDVTVNADVITATSSLPAPTVSTVSNVTVNADVNTATSSLPAPTVTAVQNVTVNADVITATSSLPAPTVSTELNASVNADVVTATSSLPAPTVSVVSNITVNADVVTITSSLPAPTVTAVQNISVSADVVTITSSAQAETVTGAAIVSSDLQTITSSLPAPSITGDAIISSDVVTITSSLPTSSISVGDGATPAAVTITSSLPAPSVTGDANVSADVIASTTSLPAPSVSGDAIISSDVVTITSSLPAPSITGDAIISADVITATSSLPAPTVTAEGGVTVSADVVTTTASLPAPSVSGDAIISSDVVTGTITTQAPTITGDAIVSGDVVTTTTSLPTPNIVTDAIISGDVVTATSSLPAPTITTGTTVSADIQTITASLPAPSVTGDAIVSSDVNTITSSLPAPTVNTGGNISIDADVVTMTSSLPSITVTGDAIINSDVVTSTLSLPAPSITGDAIVSSDVVTITSSLPSPTVTVGDGATPSPVTISASLPAPTISTGTTISADVVTITASLPAPTVQTLTEITVNADVVTMTASLPNPSLAYDIVVQVPVISVGGKQNKLILVDGSLAMRVGKIYYIGI